MSVDPTFFGPLLEAPFFKELEQALRAGGKRTSVTGLVEGSRALPLTLLAGRIDLRPLVVVPDDVALEAYRRDLSALAAVLGRDPLRIVALPAMDADPYVGIAPHPEVAKDRVVALGRLSRGEVDAFLVPARALLRWLPSPEELAGRIRVVRKGDLLPPDRFVLESLGSGYRRVETVSAPGEVSRRGGIVDIFPPSAEEPVRIELFGDSIDSIRAFDTEHQRSTGHLEQAVIGPAVESPPSEDALARLVAYLDGAIRRVREANEPVRVHRERLEQLRTQGYLPGIEVLAGVTAARPVTLFDHASDLTLIVDEPRRVEEEVARAFDEARTAHQESGDKIFPPPEELLAPPETILRSLRSAPLALYELAGEEAGIEEEVLRASTRTARSYSGKVGELVKDLREARAHQTRVVCVMRAPGSAEPCESDG